MRVVSLNAWGGRLWKALAAWLPRVGADALCLQEVTRSPAASPPDLDYLEGPLPLPQRSDLFADVARLLPGHEGRFVPAVLGSLFDQAGRAWPSEHGIACFVRRDLEVVEEVTGFVHGAFRAEGWGEEPVPRVVQVLRLRRPTGRTLRLAHLHGLRDPAGKADTPARDAQAVRLLAILDATRRGEEPTVLCGDLNLLPESRTFGDLAGLGLADLVTGHGHADTRTSFYGKPVRHADYLLVSPEVDVAAFDVPSRPEVSDHRPLILDLT